MPSSDKSPTRVLFFQGEEKDIILVKKALVKFSERRKIHNKFPWIRMAAEIRPIDTSNFEVQLGVAWEFPRSMSDSAINSFMRKVNKHIARKLAMENDQNEQS